MSPLGNFLTILVTIHFWFMAGQSRFIFGSRLCDPSFAAQFSHAPLLCKAAPLWEDYYVQSLSISLDDAVAATATAVQLACEPPTAIPDVPSAPPEMIETPTLLGEAPAEVPTEEPIIPPAPEVPTAEAAPIAP